VEGTYDTPETGFKNSPQHQFYANHKKCKFGKHEVWYLGHVILGEGFKWISYLAMANTQILENISRIIIEDSYTTMEEW